MATVKYTNNYGDVITKEVYPFDTDATLDKVEQKAWQKKYDAVTIVALDEKGNRYCGDIFGDRLRNITTVTDLEAGMKVRIKGNIHPLWIADNEGNPLRINQYFFKELSIIK